MELTHTLIVGLQIVPRESAQLSLPQETIVILDADHIGVCKFSSQTDKANLELVQIEHLYEKAREKSRLTSIPSAPGQERSLSREEGHVAISQVRNLYV
jgi:hypothetical protein